MATKFESMAEHSEMVFLGLKSIIISTCEKLIEYVHERRDVLLIVLEEIKKEYNLKIAGTLKRIKELEGVKQGFEALETTDHDDIKSGIFPVLKRISGLEHQLRPPKYFFECDITPISKALSKLGRIVNEDRPKELIGEIYSEIEDLEKSPHSERPNLEDSGPPPLPPRRRISDLSGFDLPFANSIEDGTSPTRKPFDRDKPAKNVKQTSCLCFGDRGEGKGKINNPKSICYNKSKELIFIASYDRPKIYIYSRQGFFISKFGKKTLQGPVGICVNNCDCYVADEKFNTIFKYSTLDFKNYSCSKIKKFKKGSGENEFESLQKLAIDECNDIYVIDNDNDRVTVLNADLDMQSVFGQKHLNHPKDICISSLVYVLDLSRPYCVHGFLKDGERIHNIIKYDEVSRPIYFCITPNDKVIISGAKEENLKAYSLFGSSQSIIEAKTTKPEVLCVLEQNTIACTYAEGKYALYIIQHSNLTN